MKMTCPKCGFSQKKAEDCAHCGVIIANYATYMAKKLSYKEDEYNVLRNKVATFPLKNINSPISLYLRIIAMLTLSFISYFYFASNLENMHLANQFINYLSFPLHESGHFLVSLFDIEDNNYMDVITALSGTVMQLFVPFLFFIISRYTYNNAFSGAMFLWWLSSSMVNVAVYINDARMGNYPLDEYGFDMIYGKHDWHIILNSFGSLEFDHFAAGIMLMLSNFIMMFSLAYMLYLIYSQKTLLIKLRDKKEELKDW